MRVRKDHDGGRRQFIRKVGNAAATVAAGALTSSPATPAEFPGRSDTGLRLPAGVSDKRVIQAFYLRLGEALQDSLVPAAINVNNGDEARYPDKSAMFTKGLPHDSFGRVDLSAYATFKTALASGRFSDFENIIMGGTRTLNGPQGGMAFDLCALDSVQFGQPQVPPAPAIASDQTATELVELYWGSLLRDVAFTDYGSNTFAASAAQELSAQPTYVGPRNSRGQVTTDLLFRGVFPGETLGPYISQFLITPTFFGAHPMSQQMQSYLPGIDYMTSFSDWLTVQNGNVTGLQNQIDPVVRYRRLGRDLAAFTHVDVLYEAYFTAAFWSIPV